MAKLVVNIKGQSEEFGLTDDVRDIGDNDYLTISNGNKKQYARLGSATTKLAVKKNNQKFYIQKDPVFFEDKLYYIFDGSDYIKFYTNFPRGIYKTRDDSYTFEIKNSGIYSLFIKIAYRSGDNTFFIVNIMNGDSYILKEHYFISKERNKLFVTRV
jgi:hypothetical protein